MTTKTTTTMNEANIVKVKYVMYKFPFHFSFVRSFVLNEMFVTFNKVMNELIHILPN